jgi:hypothetical protein
MARLTFSTPDFFTRYSAIVKIGIAFLRLRALGIQSSKTAAFDYLVHCGLGLPVSTNALRRNIRLPHMELQPAMNGVMSRRPR